MVGTSDKKGVKNPMYGEAKKARAEKTAKTKLRNRMKKASLAKNKADNEDK